MLLQKIRDNTQSWVAKVFLGFVILVFAMFGIESVIVSFFTPKQALVINDNEIPLTEVDRLTQQKIQEFLRSQGENPDLSNFDEADFRDAAVRELIQRELMRQSVQESGMAVSSVAIDRRILATPDFQVNGVYNDERATILLQSVGLTPAAYRRTLIEDALVNQIVTAYTASGFVTRDEIERVAALLDQKRSFRYLDITLDGASIDTDVSDEDVLAWYEANQTRFQEDEQVRIAWVELDRERLFDEVSVSETQVRARYDEEVAQFQAQTERRAAHILFEVADDSELEAALAEATSVKARIDDGEDFAALAAEFSDDFGSAEDGGDVGYTTGDTFVPEFEDALRELAVGEVSEPVRTDFGYHLIKLLELNVVEAEPFEVRRESIERALKEAEVNRLFTARSEELGNLAFESLDLAEPAAALGLEIQESDWFSRSGGTGITARSNVIEASFSIDVLEDQLNSNLIAIDPNRSVVLRVVEHREPRIAPLDEVRDEISTLLILDRMREQARQLGETVISALESGEDVDAMVEQLGMSWVEVEATERENATLHPLLLQYVFTMSPPEEGSSRVAAFDIGDAAHVVVELRAVEPGSLANLEPDEATGLISFMRQQAGSLDFAGYLLSQQDRAEIKGLELVTPTGF